MRNITALFATLIGAIFFIFATCATAQSTENPALEQYQKKLDDAQQQAAQTYQKALQADDQGPGPTPPSPASLSPAPPKSFAQRPPRPSGNPWGQSANQNPWADAARQNPWADAARHNPWAKPQAAPPTTNPAPSMQPSSPATGSPQIGSGGPAGPPPINGNPPPPNGNAPTNIPPPAAPQQPQAPSNMFLPPTPAPANGANPNRSNP